MTPRLVVIAIMVVACAVISDAEHATSTATTDVPAQPAQETVDAVYATTIRLYDDVVPDGSFEDCCRKFLVEKHYGDESIIDDFAKQWCHYQNFHNFMTTKYYSDSRPLETAFLNDSIYPEYHKCWSKDIDNTKVCQLEGVRTRCTHYCAAVGVTDMALYDGCHPYFLLINSIHANAVVGDKADSFIEGCCDDSNALFCGFKKYQKVGYNLTVTFKFPSGHVQNIDVGDGPEFEAVRQCAFAKNPVLDPSPLECCRFTFVGERTRTNTLVFSPACLDYCNKDTKNVGQLPKNAEVCLPDWPGIVGCIRGDKPDKTTTTSTTPSTTTSPSTTTTTPATTTTTTTEAPTTTMTTEKSTTTSSTVTSTSATTTLPSTTVITTHTSTLPTTSRTDISIFKDSMFAECCARSPLIADLSKTASALVCSYSLLLGPPGYMPKSRDDQDYSDLNKYAPDPPPDTRTDQRPYKLFEDYLGCLSNGTDVTHPCCADHNVPRACWRLCNGKRTDAISLPSFTACDIYSETIMRCYMDGAYPYSKPNTGG